MNIKEQADSYVEMFYIPIMQANYPNVGQNKTATHCAIIHVEGILKEITVYDTLHSFVRQSNLEEILTELKSRI
jgi:hypothetical protein